MSRALLSGLGELASAYDGFIVDLWGVLHGGIAPYPGALEALAELKRRGKRVALLSNAPRRSAVVEARLREMGFPDESWDVLLTSGEATHLALRDRADPTHAALGARMLQIGPAWDASLVAGLDYVAADDVESADFLLVIGLRDEREALESYDPLLERAARRGLVLICANPDLVVQRQDGSRWPCAGSLAQRYEEHGGRVVRHGKPDPAIFARCVEAMRVGGRVLVVGDSLTTDIPGARAAGLDSVWVTRGIHAGELGITPGERPACERLEAVMAAYGERPTAVIPAFGW
jgi:HAD superfamily hydrolase (TIGR01459 family)